MNKFALILSAALLSQSAFASLPPSDLKAERKSNSVVSRLENAIQRELTEKEKLSISNAIAQIDSTANKYAEFGKDSVDKQFSHLFCVGATIGVFYKGSALACANSLGIYFVTYSGPLGLGASVDAVVLRISGPWSSNTIRGRYIQGRDNYGGEIAIVGGVQGRGFIHKEILGQSLLMLGVKGGVFVGIDMAADYQRDNGFSLTIQ